MTSAPADAAKRTRCYRSASAAVVAKAAHATPSKVRLTRSVGRNGMPQCTFAPRARKRDPSVTVNVDSGPQAFYRLSRAVSEASQIFGVPPPGWHPPIGLRGLGPEASWFPEMGSLMALDKTQAELLTVHVGWPQASRREKIALARRIIAPFRRR